MEIHVTSSFTKSLIKLIQSSQWYRYSYWYHKWYDLKWSIKSLFHYFRIVTKMRPWDSIYILEMLKFQIELTKKCIENPSTLMECDETRIPKVEKMNRVIELLNNIIEDNFADRCGYDSEATKFNWIKIKRNPENEDEDIILDENDNSDENHISYKLDIEVIKEGYDQHKVFTDARELEKRENEELFALMQNEIRGWWV